MRYQEFIQDIQRVKFERVERDDRLLDVFRFDTREKGVELWIKWDNPTIQLVKIKLPYQEKHVWLYEFDSDELERWLKNAEIQQLKQAPPIASGISQIQQHIAV